MQQDWRDPTYLLHGTATQRAAYCTLKALRVFDLLQAFDPVLAGTIPLAIDIPGSDLDIVCYAPDVEVFARHVQDIFGHYASFVLQRTIIHALPTVIGQFASHGFALEIFGQPVPVSNQNAFRHMLVEARLLRHGGEEIRQQIRQCKLQGSKTEPAFAAVFGLTGDPYQTLLQLAELSEEQLIAALTRHPYV